MKKNVKWPIYVSVLFVLIWIIVLTVLTPYEDLKLGNGPVYQMNDGWIYTDTEGNTFELTLPTQLNISPNEPCTISLTLDEDFPDGMTILLRGSLQSVKVTLDDAVLLYAEKEQSGTFYMPMASAWYLVALPDDAAGETLSITLTSPFSAFSGTLNPIVYGNGSDVLYYLIADHGVQLFVIIMIAVLGIVLIMVSIIFRQIGSRSLLCLGLFALTLSGWFFAESRMIQLFIGNRFVIGGLAYMMLALFPIPMLCYLREEILVHFKKVLAVFTLLFGLDFIAITLLQLFGVVGFFQSAVVSNLILVCALLFAVIGLFIEIFRFRNESAKRFLIYSGLLLICAAIELFKFFTQSFDHLSAFSIIGMFVFIVMLGADAGMKLKAMVQKHSEAVFYEKMAYHDILTGANNRAAFERDIEDLFETETIENVRLVLFDLNDLKHINDTFGHAEGDEALRRAYLAMEQAFQSPSNCYRIGGDEFVCILQNCDLETYTEMRDEFIRLVEEDNQDLNYAFSVAIGSATYEKARIDDFRELLKLTDQMMYLNKAKSKQQPDENGESIPGTES